MAGPAETESVSLEVDARAAAALAAGQVGDPFSLLGPQPCGAGWLVRAYLPGALGVDLVDAGSGQVLAAMQALSPPGLYAARLGLRRPYRLRIRWPAAGGCEAEQET